MTIMAELVTRTQSWLLDEQAHGYTRAQVLNQLSIESSRLANRGILGFVTVAQAVAGLHVYPLDTMSLSLGTGTATAGDATTLTNTLVDFTVLGITAGTDRLLNATDGSVGLITTVATTVLTCAAGMTGGANNTNTVGDVYFIQSPLVTDRVVSLTQVYYDGDRLLKTTEKELDARYPGWEISTGPPKYWLTDSAVRPTELRIVPAPTVTGSGIVQIPMRPFVLDYHDNLLIFVTIDAHDPTEEMEESDLPMAYEDVLVLMAAQSMAGWQTEYENDSLAQLAGSLVDVWQDALNIEG